MKKTSWKKRLLCIVLCLAMMLSFTGCSNSEDHKTSTPATTTNTEYGDPAQCTLCPDKEHCCFCYQYKDCVCVETSQKEEEDGNKGEADGNKEGKDTNSSSRPNADKGSSTDKKTDTSDSGSNSGQSSNTSNSDNSSKKYDPKSLKGKTITIMRQWGPYTSGNNTAHDNWNKRVAELEKKYDFDIVEKAWSATLEQEVLAGVKPSGQLYQVNGDWAANYAKQGYIASWDDAMKSTGIDMKSDVYFDFSVQLCNYNNKQYAIGVEEGKIMAQVVYNKKLTSQFADIEKLIDTNEWTWEAMTDIAKKVKAKYPDKWGIGMDSLLGVYGMVASNGGQLVSIAKDGTLSSNLNNKKVREALDQIYNWLHIDKVATVPESGASWDYMLKELVKGNIAFTFNEDACYDVLKESMSGDDYGIAYLPMGPSAEEYYVCMETSWPYVMPKAYADQADDLLFVVDALYQLNDGYDKDAQFRDLYVRKFSNNTTYNRVKSMHRTVKCAPIIEIQLGSTTEWYSAIKQLYQGKTTVAAFVDSYHSSFDIYMKDTWKDFKFTGDIN